MTIPSIQTAVLLALRTNRIFSRLGHRYLIKNQSYAVPTVEQYTHTKTCASSVCKNTPKNSIVRRAVTQKFTQNAQQTSQFYSRC